MRRMLNRCGFMLLSIPRISSDHEHLARVSVIHLDRRLIYCKRLYFFSTSRRRSCGRAVTVWPSTPVMVSAPIMALTIASSVACTAASNTALSSSLGNMATFTAWPAAAASALAVEKAMKISPDPLPEVEPVRASPIVARRASRLVWCGSSGASVATTMMMDPVSSR